MGAAHSCGPAPMDPAPGSALGARYFRSATSGLLLHHRSWHPAGAPRAAVYLLHGYAEHIDRFCGFAAALAAAGFVVHGMDLVGHGGSEGDRAYLHDFKDITADVLQLITAVHPQPTLPRFLMGHSMGGLLALRTAQVAPAGTLTGLILSGPALLIAPEVDNALNRLLARTLSGVWPKLPVQPVDARMLCSDPAVCAQFKRDPLCYQGAIRVRTGAEVIKAIDAARAAAPAMGAGLALLVVHGADDALCRVEGSRQLLALATGVPDRALIEYAGLLHEITSEREGGARVAADVIAWLAARAGAAAAAGAPPPAAG